MVPNPLKIRTKIAVSTLRIFSLPSVSQTEFNSHTSREIHRLAFAFRRLELDLLRRASCCFIKTVAQTTYHPVHLDAAVRKEYHIENNVAFYFETTPFRGVLRTRFVQDVNGRRGVFAGRRFLLRRVGHGCLIREAGGLQRAAPGARWRIRRAITEAGARHRAANSLIAAGAVAVSRPTWQSGRTKTIDVRGFVGIPFAGNSVWIAEAAGLHFVHRSHDGCRSSAAGSQITDFHIFFRPLWLVRRRIDFHLFEYRIEFHGFCFQGLYLGWRDFCREKNVRLFRVQFHRFRLHRLWFRTRNLGLHLRRTWRRWCNRDFRNRLHQLHNSEAQCRLHLLWEDQRKHQQKTDNRELSGRAQTNAVPSWFGIREQGQACCNWSGADSFLPRLRIA